MKTSWKALGAVWMASSVAVVSCGTAEIHAIPYPCPACEDGDPCTIDTCDEYGTCSHTAAEDGYAPPGEQVSGDCWLTICIAGKLDERMEDTDTPPVDAPCVVQTVCLNGSVHAVPAPAGEACALDGHAGVCDGEGACVPTA